MSDFRNILGRNGAPVQQSMTMDSQYYGGRQMNTVMYGVVLSVFQSDDQNNETAIRTAAQHGHMHQCNVLIVNDGYGSNTILPKVFILPDQVSGIDDYSEHLPKGCVKTLSGQPFNSNLLGIDPEDLDGERCLVSFIGGNIDQPFILKWFPHSKNVFDPMTTGSGYPDSDGLPRALDQSGRKFVRVNGVEYVISKTGDVYLSTNFANSVISPEKTSSFGRFGRTVNEQVGGSIRVNVKPSQRMMIDFNEYQDGIGANGRDPALPQTNPKPDNYGSLVSYANTNILIDQSQFKVSAPEEINIYSGGNTYINSDGSTTITTGGDYIETTGGNFAATTNGDRSVFVEGASLDVVRGQRTEAYYGDVFTEAFKDVKFNIQGNTEGKVEGELFLELKGKANIVSGDIINLGSAEDLEEKDTLLKKDFLNDPIFLIKKTVVETLPPATTPATTAALTNALKEAFIALVDALENTTTNTTRAR